MTVGLPGSGIGGVLYCVLVVLLPLRALARRRRWRPAVRHCSMVGVMFGLLWLQAWALDTALAPAEGAPAGAAAASAAPARQVFVEVGQFAAIGSFLTLGALLLGGAIAARLLRREPVKRLDALPRRVG